MSTIEITRVDDLREGDLVKLRWEHEDGATVTLEGPMWNRMVGGYTVTDARFVSATREVPEWEPGTAGTATVMGTPGVRVMRVQLDDRATDARPWFTDHTIGGWFAHAEGDVTDFKPDDAEALRAELDGLWASLDSPTNLLMSKNGTIWHHDQNCPNRRTVPTREQVAMSMYAELKGAIDLSWGRLDPIDRGEWERAADTVLALIDQGGAS